MSEKRSINGISTYNVIHSKGTGEKTWIIRDLPEISRNKGVEIVNGITK